MGSRRARWTVSGNQWSHQNFSEQRSIFRGIYDFEYLSYLQKLLSLLPQFGLRAFVSLHQDVWSRYTGGSGAPLWTLTLLGLDVHALEETGAAWLKGVQGGGHIEAERGLWPCGYQKMAAATMNTAFWAGNVFMPKTVVTDPGSNSSKVNVQTFLQDRFLDMWEQLAKAVGGLEGVLGFEVSFWSIRRSTFCQSHYSEDHERTSSRIRWTTVSTWIRLQYRSPSWSCSYVFITTISISFIMSYRLSQLQLYNLSLLHRVTLSRFPITHALSLFLHATPLIKYWTLTRSLHGSQTDPQMVNASGSLMVFGVGTRRRRNQSF